MPDEMRWESTERSEPNEMAMLRLGISDRDRLIGSYEIFVELAAPFIPKESAGLTRLMDDLKERTNRLYGDDV